MFAYNAHYGLPSHGTCSRDFSIYLNRVKKRNKEIKSKTNKSNLNTDKIQWKKMIKIWQIVLNVCKKKTISPAIILICVSFSWFFVFFSPTHINTMNHPFIGSPAPGQPTTTMIMEGLETFVAPSHHAFLLTESAAAAHFNVLSFDTCLLKSAATTTTSFANNNNNNNNNLFTINNNNNHNNNSSSNSHNNNNNDPSTSPGINCNIVCMGTSNSSNNNDTSHPSHHIDRNSTTEHQSHSIADAQTGDLNTPVTTSSDIPSFFGPNTIEPPTITGKLTKTISTEIRLKDLSFVIA